MAGLHTHHDHARSLFGVGIARFELTVLCDQCNAADGLAKRKHKIPDNFSFLFEEIGKFVIANTHSKHQIDVGIAELIYRYLVARGG